MYEMNVLATFCVIGAIYVAAFYVIEMFCLQDQDS